MREKTITINMHAYASMRRLVSKNIWKYLKASERISVFGFEIDF